MDNESKEWSSIKRDLGQMGLNEEDTNILCTILGYPESEKYSVIDPVFLEPVIKFVKREGDPFLYSELLHTAYSTRDTNDIITVIMMDEKASKFFGLTSLDALKDGLDTIEGEVAFDTTLYKKHGANMTSLIHDLSLMLTKSAIVRWLGLVDSPDNPVERFVKSHHQRSRDIFAKVMQIYKDGIIEGNSGRSAIYNQTMDCMKMSYLTKLGKSPEEQQEMVKNRLFSLVPMIVDACKYTEHNYIRALGESAFIRDHVENYLLRNISRDTFLKKIRTITEDNVEFGEKISGPHIFDHNAMAERCAKKKGFVYLDHVRDNFPGVYNAIVQAGEDGTMEIFRNHVWFANGAQGGRIAVKDALRSNKIFRDNEARGTLNKLDDVIEKYQRMIYAKPTIE